MNDVYELLLVWETLFQNLRIKDHSIGIKFWPFYPDHSNEGDDNDNRDYDDTMTTTDDENIIMTSDGEFFFTSKVPEFLHVLFN